MPLSLSYGQAVAKQTKREEKDGVEKKQRRRNETNNNVYDNHKFYTCYAYGKPWNRWKKNELK